MTDLPAWLTCEPSPAWPVRIEDLDAGLTVGVPGGWTELAASPAGPSTEWGWRGDASGELLSVSRVLASGVDGESVEDWSSALRALTGLPFVADPRSLPLDLLAVDRSETTQVIGGRLVATTGTAVAPDAKLAIRFYTVAVEREDDAVLGSLSLPSACLPGAPNSLVVDNDHVRAVATFGPLVSTLSLRGR